uniref:Integrase catalytic domain-containing protein n=1 Tax=Meloidogyne hapla TaxID=6305 RepID=A0A1I8BIW5_MELHA
MPEGFKNPILLPKGHSAVKLIIEKIHVELLHSGVDAVLGNFLIKYWSPGARREAKKVVKNCKKCQKINGPKFALPLMPGLPKERLRKSRAFEAIGVDYLGPSLYKIENGKAKFWIALFTCLSTRAVHLEIALELSALEFMHCLRRFIAIRGCPKKIISDNATQFKVGSELVGAKFVGKWIEKSKNEEKRINNFLINKGIEWCFIPSLSPWAGGVYERLVKLVKDSFKRTLGASNPTYLVSCKGCRMKCQSFGIQINVGPEINKVEICCMSTCIIETNGLEHLELELPKDVTALNYKCRAKYMNGRRIFRGNIFCPAVDPCLRIKEIWERILNPQCESTKSMVIVGIFLGLLFCLLISGMFCAFKVFSILSSIFSIIWKIIKAMFKLSSKKDEKVKSKESESLIDCSQKLKKIKRIKRNRRLNRLGLLNIMVLIIFVEIVRADIEVISVQAKSEDCYRSKNITTCKITTSNTLTLLPDGQVISLTLKNDKGMIMGEMEFIMNSLSIKCNQKSQRQLRSYELKVGSVKRCPAQGTCKAGACQHIRSKENVEELLEWSGNPGNSYCVEGHALWGYQCGLPGAACYFYKVYAEPKSSEIYELVTCPTWDYVIDMEVSMRFKGNISKYGFSINPGMTVKWDKIKISLMDITPPIAPILSSQFIMGNNGVAMVDNFKTDLECEDASNFSR